jgi:Sec-independent protein secretion pathway component TatC
VVKTPAKLCPWGPRGGVVAFFFLPTTPTPGTDIVSPLILAVTLLILYEFSIILVKAGGK